MRKVTLEPIEDYARRMGWKEVPGVICSRLVERAKVFAQAGMSTDEWTLAMRKANALLGGTGR